MMPTPRERGLFGNTDLGPTLKPLLPWLLALVCLRACAAGGTPLAFEVGLQPGLSAPENGRLFVILSRVTEPDPRFRLSETGPHAPVTLARDVGRLMSNQPVLLDASVFLFPLAQLGALPPGEYSVQALLDVSRELKLTDAPGNFYSTPTNLYLHPADSGKIHLDLSHRIPPETIPADSAEVNYVRLESKLLSEFHHRPASLRAGVILPRDYGADPTRKYPLWIQIGGFNTRYTEVGHRMRAGSSFRDFWLADDTPRFILLHLDGAGPFGDPYYVNSDNNGPYGDALVKELIPFVEARFRAVGQPRARVLSGSSTGGWVSLALQVFYPDFFNGTWSSCPDPVDFRAFELIDLYADTNAYVNVFGHERPSTRLLTGDVKLTMRREVGMENLLGRGNRFTCSGEQWGSWNAVFSPRGADGLPAPIWDPVTGDINPAVVEKWKRYDLRLVLERDWATLGPKLRGKIHIAVGEADEYFLNNAVHLLDDFLKTATPPFVGKIAYGPGKGHGWMDLSPLEMLKEMEAATR